MGSNGRRWVAEHLPWKVVAAQMARAYEDLVRDHCARQACVAEDSAATAKTFQ